MFSGTFGVTHWLIVIGVLVVLFGAKRLPAAARGLGQSMRILKAELRDDPDEDDRQK
ncbi:Sec-independent protein translocase subunit TatA [Saccharopolyspora sp. 5N708]|uniref:Sec-independent protein translocase subunit TatA n=1 Tax=Saccharopolyspora sp. 5N708 TaxID=3457424 RepID=UPI003FD275D5